MAPQFQRRPFEWRQWRHHFNFGSTAHRRSHRRECDAVSQRARRIIVQSQKNDVYVHAARTDVDHERRRECLHSDDKFERERDIEYSNIEYSCAACSNRGACCARRCASAKSARRRRRAHDARQNRRDGEASRGGYGFNYRTRGRQRGWRCAWRKDQGAKRRLELENRSSSGNGRRNGFFRAKRRRETERRDFER